MSESQEKKHQPERTNVLGQVSSPLPRVTIQFCTQCKWMLRAAYYAQELLSTFNTSLGEVALQPSTGGTFIVSITTNSSSQPATFSATTSFPPGLSAAEQAGNDTGTEAGGGVQTKTQTLWDRKIDGGFPETKELKRRVRDVIEPGRNLGHVDKDYGKSKTEGAEDQKQEGEQAPEGAGGGEAAKARKCEDCQ